MAVKQNQIRRVLLVDDDLNTRITMKAIFELYGYLVRAAENAQRALCMAEVWKFDVLLTDIVMYGMDGVELAGLISDNYPTVKIVFMTAHTKMKNYYRAAELGTVLTKPINIPFLLEYLNKTL